MKAETKTETKSSFQFKFNQEVILLLVLIGVIIFFSIMSPTFLTGGNLINIIRQVALLGIIAAGMTMVLLIGGIDLSVASNVAFTSVVMGMLITAGIPPWIAIIVGIIAGVFVGAVNGLIVTRVGIPALITTLGMLTMLRGTTFVITGGYPVFGFPESIRFFGNGYLLGIPVPAIIMVAVFVGVYILLYKTYIGRHIYALGGNLEATRLSGINTKKVQMLVYMLSGFFCSIAGLILLGRLNSGQPNALQGFELEVVTAVVLGGVSIFGGQGKLIGVVLGVFILGVLANGLVILNINEFYQMVISGAVLLVAVGIDRIYNRKKD
ncbi:ribose ABC transporter permease [Salipaludibacillus neizhouensis]|uniref:Ribose ABC transporter permease n=1 Tax=Salipaludibacillus neizhouensis TaxID=885475 RepID=A0A3A9KQW4_9BACI|nr:ABC transporter permease [Salipaludibacillus neizhouensis]RKL67066.1 ribose ABC transporter permease [Salipaludibacillus neizhouensis]